MNQNLKEMILSENKDDAYLAMNMMQKLEMDIESEVLVIFHSRDTNLSKALDVLFNYYNWREINEPESKRTDPF